MARGLWGSRASGGTRRVVAPGTLLRGWGYGALARATRETISPGRDPPRTR